MKTVMICAVIFQDHGVKDDELQSILNYLLTMHEVGTCIDREAALSSGDITTRWQHNITILFFSTCNIQRKSKSCFSKQHIFLVIFPSVPVGDPDKSNFCLQCSNIYQLISQ